MTGLNSKDRWNRILDRLRTARSVRSVTFFPMLGDRYHIRLVGGCVIRKNLRAAGFKFRDGAWDWTGTTPYYIEDAFRV